jgi:hypothetical protein
MKVGIYIRVSTEEQLDNFSLEAQPARCEAWIVAKDWELHEVYCDVISGKSLIRPRYQDMIQDFESQKLQGIVVFKLDRLSRSTSDMYAIIKRFSKERWGLSSVTVHIDIDHTCWCDRWFRCYPLFQSTRELLSNNAWRWVLSKRKKKEGRLADQKQACLDTRKDLKGKKLYAVIYDGGDGGGHNWTSKVCTWGTVQGLCDMSG